jgi:F-type H+-transporting ATPase subunit delta
MAELQTLARPYAKAVFELAQQTGSLQTWTDRLQGIAQAVAAPGVDAMIGHPKVTRQAIASAIAGALGGALGAEGDNFVKLLAENGRLKLAPLIAEQFEALRAEAETRVDVEITSAAEVPTAQQATLSSAVSSRLHRQVAIDWKVDESLIAGAVIRAGDLVIDGSVSGELARLKSALAQ